jgi:hypothetical protein
MQAQGFAGLADRSVESIHGRRINPLSSGDSVDYRYASLIGNLELTKEALN